MRDFLNSANVNSIGLGFDLVGILFVAYSFKNIRREKTPLGLMGGGEETQKKLDKENKFLISLDRTGMSFLVIGFGLQIISNYI